MKDERGNYQLDIFYQQISQSSCHQVSFDKISAIKVFLNFHLNEKNRLRLESFLFNFTFVDRFKFVFEVRYEFIRILMVFMRCSSEKTVKISL